MSLRELPPAQQPNFSGNRNYWGLTVQRGPWKETPADKYNASLPSTKWYGGGVPQGGTGPGKRNATTTLDRGRVSFMPAPPGPSKYAQRRVVMGPVVLGGGATLGKLMVKKEDIFGGDMTGSTMDHPYQPHYFDSQVGMDMQSEQIKKEMGITDDIPSLYPQAGAFERQIDTLAFLENVQTQNPLTPLADMNAMGERMYDTIGQQDAAAAGGYVNQIVQMPSAYESEDNILHLEPMPGAFPIPVFIPPRESLERQMGQVSENLRTKSQPLFSNMPTPTLDEEMRQEAMEEAQVGIEEERSGYVQNRVNQFFSESWGGKKRKPEQTYGVGKKKARTGEAPSLKRKRAASEEREMKKTRTGPGPSLKRKRAASEEREMKKTRTGPGPSLKRKRSMSEERVMKKTRTGPGPSLNNKKRPREYEPNSPRKKAKAPPQSYLGKRKRGKEEEGESKKPKTKGRGAKPSSIITTELQPSAQGRTGMTKQTRAENKSAPKNRDQLPSPRPRRRR